MALSAITIAGWRATVGRTGFTLGLLLATAAGALLDRPAHGGAASGRPGCGCRPGCARPGC